MSLIPPEAGILMRSQLDTSLQPATPVQGIPSDLPDLQPGQVFAARIQEVLPDNTYRALVAGKSLTLALPEGAKAGDSLELMVVDRSNKVVIAKLATPEQAAELGDTFRNTTLSPAGQLIGKLLVSDGETLKPAALNQGQALLAAPPKDAAQLAAALNKAAGQSGLFYESHQAQWVAGKMPLRELMQEPQAQLSTEAAKLQAKAETNATPSLSAEEQAITSNVKAKEADLASATTRPSQSTNTQTIADPLRPLVQQQLEAAVSNRLIWHGEAWPGQKLEWEVEREARQQDTENEEAPAQWRTSLRLTMPRMGSIETTLHLTEGGVRLTINAPSDSSADDLRAATPELAKSFDAAGLKVLSLSISHEPEAS